MKSFANNITFSRIVFALLMLSSTFCSLPFWICYFWCGISDILDGLVARKLRQQSGIGAKLDSIADFIFAVTILVTVGKNIALPMYLWWCIVAIALLRLISYSIGFFKYRTFSSLHTLMNKITGISIFAFPLLYICFGLDVAGIMICIVAFLSSFEEIAIMIKSKELNRDIKSIFM
ncbi:CDP-alcohol phosphatidyltransferase family protein [Clostridioides difficile]|nr:CDP-alcohol phosphatidyltransferase family protein [Clostridioides difficile]EGT5470247.1 CDP-alcohol phosphatidyltransferase family protein [Clostridioides difficile]MBH8089050.1 CDP-alcohol phosphatidyltransferase family protein [Clostridioides difficile]MBY1607728.1 CDP-alcohol phosphatidyltransferase family protein [Clostridioides difficile]MBY2078446.1 CDP-alcohol phosphatidyltransferase family protein [Clostridioides difficile]